MEGGRERRGNSVENVIKGERFKVEEMNSV